VEGRLRAAEEIMLARRIAIVRTQDALSYTVNASQAESTARIAIATGAAITLKMSLLGRRR
jgi:hypothetical protein